MQNNTFPFEMREVDRKQAEELMMYFKGELTGFIQVGPKGYFFPIKYREIAADIYNMPLRQDDIFVASFPRSGTTWTQELVWILANDLNYKKSSEIPIMNRFPILEMSMNCHPNMVKQFIVENQDSKQKLMTLDFITQPRTELLAVMSSPRFIKTHLPISLLPPTLMQTAKMLYVARDPRDVAVSYYYLNKTQLFLGYVGDFKSFWSYFIKGLCCWTPYFEHLKEAWELRDHPNFLFLFYEELTQDLPSVIKRVARFLKKEYTDKDVQKLCEHLSFENFKNSKSINHDVTLAELGLHVMTEQLFIRKGKVGGWRNYFDEDMAKQAEDWMAENLKGTCLSFPQVSRQHDSMQE